MNNDIIESLHKALIIQKWNEGDKNHRIGHPFQWIDAETKAAYNQLSEIASIMPHFTLFYEKYPTPEEIKVADFEDVEKEVQRVMSSFFLKYFPFLNIEQYRNYIDCTALTRTQDYAFVKTFANPGGPNIKHLDIGPGLGSHAAYSRYGFKSLYCGLEAYPPSYQVQRNFFRSLSSNDALYVDFVTSEIFGQNDSDIWKNFKDSKEGILHIPSWKFRMIDDNYFDLITATWVFNEVNTAGILWLVSNCIRTLKTGGYLYIRDSHKLKPGRHNINYDSLLQNIGFKEVGRLQVENRVDFYGIPRIYRKLENIRKQNFDGLVDEILGHFGVAAHYGEFNPA